MALATGKEEGGQFPDLVWHLVGWADDLVKLQSARTPRLQKPEPLLGLYQPLLLSSPGIHRKSSCEESESGTANLGDPLTWLSESLCAGMLSLPPRRVGFPSGRTSKARPGCKSMCPMPMRSQEPCTDRVPSSLLGLFVCLRPLFLLQCCKTPQVRRWERECLNCVGMVLRTILSLPP